MVNSGKTPLLRARNLEKAVGMKRIYIKLEGANPSESIIDRYTERQIYSALAQGYQNVIADGSKYFLKSVIYFASLKNLNVSTIYSSKDKWKSKLFTSEQINVLNKKDYSTADIMSFATKENAFCLLEENQDDGLIAEVSSSIAEELILKVKEPIDTVFFKSNQELFNHGLYNRFLANYILVQQIPEFYSLSTKPKTSEVANDLSIELAKEDIDSAYDLLKKQEYLDLEKEDAIAFALFLKKKAAGLLKQGNHVIILNTAKTHTNLKKIDNFNEYSKTQLVQIVDTFLVEYSDPIEGIAEAIDNAVEDGFIVIATRNKEVVGIGVIVNTGFHNFIPMYHLAYFGTNPQSKGRGVGTDIMKYALDLTDGNLSLHVDLKNSGAKRLYEKMGFEHCYSRMIYQNKEE